MDNQLLQAISDMMDSKLGVISANMATKEDIADMATKEDIAKMATKEDLRTETNMILSELDSVESRLNLKFDAIKEKLRELEKKIS